MSLPDIRLALRALEDESIDRADLLRVITVLESWQRGELRGSCAELLVREFRVDPAKVRRWETEIAGQPVQRIGKYLLKRRIGQGGMGMVFEAEHPNFERSVALKTLHLPDRAADGTLIERFMREARSAAKLRHPGIVTVLDVDEDKGRHFFTMEFVEGRSFEKCLRAPDAGAEFPLRRRVGLLQQVAEALGHAHRAGVIHRDVKP